MCKRGIATRLSIVVAAALTCGTCWVGAAEIPATVPPELAKRAAAIRQKMANKITNEQRHAAAAAKAKAAAARRGKVGVMATMPMPGGRPNYFGPEPNWAYSPQPTVDPVTGAISGGIRKFMDSLPGLTAVAKNAIGQYIPIAVKDTTTYSGSDYYEIAAVEWREQMHTDLKPTTLRGYVQVATTVVPGDPTLRVALTYPDGTPILDAGGNPVVAVEPPHYLGPLIVATKNRPVRIKFTNYLPKGAAGKLFVPVDTTVMGAGMGPKMMNVTPGYPMNYTENRVSIPHLHGNSTVWISDGTMHQWVTPAGEVTDYPKGASVANVPDMPDPGEGSVTMIWTNQQSARLMFYHDHVFGITRLNVYAGVAAGYVLTDATEQELIGPGGALEGLGVGIPLVIQDKTFLDTTPVVVDPVMRTTVPQVLITDPTWPFPVDANLSNLWLPHVYMPNQNPNVLDGVNPLGRWDYGPWIWPPFPADNPPITNPDGTVSPNLPNVSMGMENFLDTPLVNGTAYPYLEVEPKAYRFRILNAANDRFWNLQLHVADPTVTTADGRTNTEVKMVPFWLAQPDATPWPTGWPTPDLRDGGIPDPKTRGPQIIQIGTEGGFLPAPVVFDNIPIGWDRDPKSMTVGNILEHNLFLGCAERADVIIDFSQFAGKTLILYNDAPAAVPARDPRYDYYTGNADETATGGTVPTLPGYGPNIRTIMQIRVANTAPAPAFDLAKLQATFRTTTDPVTGAEIPGVFARSQEPIIVPQAAYNSAYGLSGIGTDTFPSLWTAYERIQDTSLTFRPLDLSTPALGDMVANPVTIVNRAKAIIEEFNTDWGRMAGFLGVEVPFTNALNQTSLWFRIQDPVTEIINDTADPVITPIGTAGDGTQLWKITHNGVDTHPIHFHLFNVQVVNRVDWAGVVKPPEPNELGWKETVRMNPLEDIIVALRPVASKQPFGVPDSIRLLDPTMPQGWTNPPNTTMGFQTFDANGDPVTTVNDYYNFGWEYMWHCHILSHEEMDMMRPIQFNVARALPAPAVLSAAGTPGNPINLTWTDPTPAANPATLGNPANEIGFRIERATGIAPWTAIGTALANATTFVDNTTVANTYYRYRVVAFNAAGDSPVSNVVAVGPPIPPPNAPTNLTAQLRTGPLRIQLTFRDNATNETGFVVQRSVNGGAFVQIATLPPRNGTGSVNYTDTTVLPGTTYTYRVAAMLGSLPSAYSNTVTVVVPPVPAAPSNFRVTSTTLTNNNTRVTVNLAWVDNSNNETGFVIQRALDAAFTVGLNVDNRGANTTTRSQTGLLRATGYYYRIAAVNNYGQSAWVNLTQFPFITP